MGQKLLVNTCWLENVIAAMEKKPNWGEVDNLLVFRHLNITWNCITFPLTTTKNSIRTIWCEKLTNPAIVVT